MDDKVVELLTHQVSENLSDQSLCEQVPIARQTLYNLKKELTTPRPSTIEVITEYLNKNE